MLDEPGAALPTKASLNRIYKPFRYFITGFTTSPNILAVVLQLPINLVLIEKWLNWTFSEERCTSRETYRKKTALPSVLLVSLTKALERELTTGAHLLFSDGSRCSVTGCPFLVSVLDLPLGKAPPVFTVGR